MIVTDSQFNSLMDLVSGLNSETIVITRDMVYKKFYGEK